MTTSTVPLHHYTQGPPDAHAVFLVGALGTSLALWDNLAVSLSGDYHVVRVDLRGHGSSPSPPGPYTLGDLAEDVVALADDLELDRFGYVGLSLGGAVGLMLALDHADRLTTLVLAGTAARFGDPATWHERSTRVIAEGMSWLVSPTRERWFTSTFAATHPDEVADVMTMLADTSPVGYAACCDAMAGFDVTERLGEVTTPTRVLTADQDVVAPPEATRVLVEGIPGADEVVLPGAAHISHLARPWEFDDAVAEHLQRTDPTAS